MEQTKVNSEQSVFVSLNQSDIALYLKQIRGYKVMTAKREREISERMQSPDITDLEKEMLEKEVIYGNLRFVVTTCKEFQNMGLGLADLISEGNYGLLKAFKKFNWSMNVRFISYAKWWIKQSILESIYNNSRTVRLPVNKIQEFQRFKKEFAEFDKSLEMEERVIPKSVSLDNKFCDDGSSAVDMPNESGGADFVELESQKKLREKLLGILSKLQDRERYIIEQYYGIGTDAKKLDDIGDYLGLTKERVRQIKENTIRKLRNETLELFDFL